MEIVTAIAGIVGGLVALAGYITKIIHDVKTSQSEKRLTDQEIALNAAKEAIAAAEELGNKKGGEDGKEWSPDQKRDFALDYISRVVPGLKSDDVTALMHAALNLSELGASAWEQVSGKK